LDGVAAVDGDGYAGYEVAGGAGQVDGGAGEVGGLAPAAGRGAGEDLVV
jgi:hypothetical protein